MAKLPFVINDGKWHHICITWTTRDGVWEAYQDGTQGGNGENLAPYHPIKPQGVLVLGQEQVQAVGGRDRVRGKWGHWLQGEEPHNRRLGRRKESVLGGRGERQQEAKVSGYLCCRGNWAGLFSVAACPLLR